MPESKEKPQDLKASYEIVQAKGMAALTKANLRLLQATIASGTTEAEFWLFVTMARRLQLDPFARQIFAVKRWSNQAQREVMQVQVSIDGLRLIASRSSAYEGQTEPEFTDGTPCPLCEGKCMIKEAPAEGAEPSWTPCPLCKGEGIRWMRSWVSSEPPKSCRVGVKRRGFTETLYATARYESYVQTNRKDEPTAVWRQMPEVMLSKCAESLALRKAFPNELGGVHSEEEMQQASNGAPEPAREVRKAPTTKLSDIAARHQAQEPAQEAPAEPEPNPTTETVEPTREESGPPNDGWGES